MFKDVEFRQAVALVGLSQVRGASEADRPRGDPPPEPLGRMLPEPPLAVVAAVVGELRRPHHVELHGPQELRVVPELIVVVRGRHCGAAEAVGGRGERLQDRRLVLHHPTEALRAESMEFLAIAGVDPGADLGLVGDDPDLRLDRELPVLVERLLRHSDREEQEHRPTGVPRNVAGALRLHQRFYEPAVREQGRTAEPESPLDCAPLERERGRVDLLKRD